MKFFITLFLILFSTIVNSCIAQKKSIKNKYPKLYLMLEPYGPCMQQFIKNNNIQIVKGLNEGQFLKTDNYEFNIEELRRQIKSVYPGKYDSGIAYLDIESPYLEKLRDLSPDDNDFKKSLKLYLDILNIAQTDRPNVSWGYYSIPFTTYWEISEDYFKKNIKITKLLKKCDVFFPSLYSFYKNTDMSTFNDKYAIENVKASLYLGLKFNKPVMPFVWHRYHNSHPKVGLEIIPEGEWYEHLRYILDTKINDNRVDGVVWWGPDQYFFDIGMPALRKEYIGSSRDYFNHNDTIITKKATDVQNILTRIKN